MYEQGIITVRPTEVLGTWSVQIRNDSGMLVDFEVKSARIDINVGEYVKVELSPPIQRGDRPRAIEIYSFTRKKRIFPKSLLNR